MPNDFSVLCVLYFQMLINFLGNVGIIECLWIMAFTGCHAGFGRLLYFLISVIGFSWLNV